MVLSAEVVFSPVSKKVLARLLPEQSIRHFNASCLSDTVLTPVQVATESLNAFSLLGSVSVLDLLSGDGKFRELSAPAFFQRPQKLWLTLLFGENTFLLRLQLAAVCKADSDCVSQRALILISDSPFLSPLCRPPSSTAEWHHPCRRARRGPVSA